MDNEKQITQKDLENTAAGAVKMLLLNRFGAKFTEWEQQYAPRQLNYIEVEDKCAVLRPITAKDISTYSMAIVDPEKGMDVATRFLLEELWLDGDDEIRDDEDYFISAMLQVQNIVQTKHSRFMKL